MFRVHHTETKKTYRLAVIGLLLLSVAALSVTVWVMIDFLREQSIVEGLIENLPADARDSAKLLAGELRWQFRLTILVVLNVVVTGIAVVLFSQAYRSSQESLRDIKALASDILSSVDQAVITTDLTGNITSINRRALELLTPESECVGQPLEVLSTVPLHDFRNDWLAEQSTMVMRDFHLSKKGAKDRTLRAFCQALRDYEGIETGNVLQLRDVSERVLIEDQMRRMERYMGLGSLVGGLHHEIKNPLAALSLHVQLLEEQIDDQGTSVEVRQMLGVIKTEVTRIGGVLEGFRDFASIGQLKLALLNLINLITGIVELVKPRAEQCKIDITVNSINSLVEILGDRVRLEQVVLNLIVNAMEAMPDGGKISIDVVILTDVAQVEVTDSGAGIPVELQDKVLDPYFTTKNEGTGLGLAICDKIMRQHHGSLEFRTSERGTTFLITLPTAPRNNQV